MKTPSSLAGVIRRAATVVVFAAALAGNARADPVELGGFGAQVFPIDNADIALVRETVHFNERPAVGAPASYERGFMDLPLFDFSPEHNVPFEHEVDVEAVLTFRNDANEPQRVQLGFPVLDEFLADRVNQKAEPWPHEKLVPGRFRVEVNGRPVKVQILYGFRGKSPEQDRWNTVFLFEVTFAPHAETVVTHRYVAGITGSDTWGNHLTYIFETGGHWKGSIGCAEFVFTFPGVAPPNLRLEYDKMTIVGAHRPPTGVRTTRNDVTYEAHFAGGPRATLRVAFYDIKPNADLEWHYGPGRDIPRKICGKLKYFYEQHEWDAFHLRADYVLESVLVHCSEKAAVRNAIYAARGYPFQDGKWTKMFYETGIYHRSTEPFSESWLTPAEKSAIAQLERAAMNKRHSSEKNKPSSAGADDQSPPAPKARPSCGCGR